MEQVKYFFIEESKVNKGLMMLVAVTNKGNKYVVSEKMGDACQLVEYEKSFDAIGEAAFKTLTGQ